MATDDLIRQFMEENGVTDLTSCAQAVSAIPWGEARTVEEVLDKGFGTCTGKHLLLQKCLDALSIPYQPVVCTFRWNEQDIDLPDHLKDILDEGEWVHGHNFIQVQGMDLDVTWDPDLSAYGFGSLPEDWNGSEPFVGLTPIIERWDGVDISEKKKELIGSLDEDQRERRDRFLNGFIEWIGSLR